MFTENLDVFLRDFGVTCKSAGLQFTGVIDMPDETLSLAGVNVISTMYRLRVKSDDVAAAGIASGSAINVDGQDYVVRDVLLEDDGVFTNLTMSK